jgi:hypothetical protein
MDKSEAIRSAIENAAMTQINYGIWIVGPGRYEAQKYVEGDRFREGFLAMAWPDGGIDYEAHLGRGDSNA